MENGLFMYEEVLAHDKQNGEGNHQVHYHDPVNITLHLTAFVTKNLNIGVSGRLDDVNEEEQRKVDKDTPEVSIFGDDLEG